MKNENILKNNTVVFLLATLCCALWGSAFPCVKLGYEFFGIETSDSFSQILFAGIRFFTAGVITLFIYGLAPDGGTRHDVMTKYKKIVPGRKSTSYILILALFQTVLQYICFYIGLAHTDGTKGSVITASNVFLTIIISAVFFRQEKLTLKKIVGCVLGFTGIVIINLHEGFSIGFSFSGEGLIFLSALSYAVSSALIKRFSKYENPVMLCGWQFVAGGTVMILVGLLFGGTLNLSDKSGIFMLLYLAVLSAAAFSVWGMLLKYNPVFKVSVYGFMNPVFGVVFSALLLSETINIPKAVAALVLVSAGIFTANFDKIVK
ncbi:MAG: DMT family transporter [Porcipelethomonas sp.]